MWIGGGSGRGLHCAVCVCVCAKMEWWSLEGGDDSTPGTVRRWCPLTGDTV